MEYIRNTYQVPAEKGRRVRYSGGATPKEGVIVGDTGAHIQVQFDGEDKVSGPFHPTWKMEYLEMGDLPEPPKRTTRTRKSPTRRW